MMPAVNIGTIFIHVTVLEKSIEFYTKLLGLSSRGIEDWGEGRRGATLFFDHASVPMVTLVEVREVVKFEQAYFNLNCTAIEEMYQLFKDSGYKVTELEQWESDWNNHVLFDVKDPDGNVINLIEMQKK